eukprot:6446227-Heterocapsa_arctica.AAC.1
MFQELVQGGLLEPLLELWLHFTSTDFAGKLSLLDMPRASKSTFQRDQDDVVVSCMFRMAVQLVGNVAVTSAQYQMPPLCFIALTCPQDSVRQ